MKAVKASKKTPVQDVRYVLDELLARAGRLTAQVTSLEREMERRIAQIQAEFTGPMERFRAELSGVDEQIKKIAAEHDAELFPPPEEEPESWVRLRYGTIIRSIERRVKRARGVLQKLEALGHMDAVKIAKSVDWAKLESWPDEDLEAVGTERVVRTVYGYNLKQDQIHEPQEAVG